MIGKYVQITVHEDVLDDVNYLVGRMREEMERGASLNGLELDNVIHSLQHLTDPLPEPDVNGYTPNIRRNVIPADLDLTIVND